MGYAHTHPRGGERGSRPFFLPPESRSVTTRQPRRAPHWSPLLHGVRDLSSCGHQLLRVFPRNKIQKQLLGQEHIPVQLQGT